MAVTKQTYTLNPGRTALDQAAAFRSAFIDAGLMTDWHASFLSGTVENRVLRVVYDNTKTYGTVFYWFKFNSGDSVVYHSMATGWDSGSNTPTGTSALDYVSTGTNNTTNFAQLATIDLSISCTLTRYTSAVNAACSWFLCRSSTNATCFAIPIPGFGPTGIIDQNKLAFLAMCKAVGQLGSSGWASRIAFVHISPTTGRTYLGGASAGSQSASNANHDIRLLSYFTPGKLNQGYAPANLETSGLGMNLPVATTNSQTALATNHTPVFTGPSVSQYLQQLPSDFAIIPFYSDTAVNVQDKFIVSTGTEEYEVIAAHKAQSGDAQTLFAARITG